MIKKNLIFTLLASLFFMIISCRDDDDRYDSVSYDTLPALAKNFLADNFPNINTREIFKLRNIDSDGTLYEIKLVNNVEIDFDSTGNWVSVDGNGYAVPKTFINQNITNYLNTNYSTYSIESIERQYNNFEVDLINGPDLIFDSQGNFIQIKY